MKEKYTKAKTENKHCKRILKKISTKQNKRGDTFIVNPFY